MNFIIKLCVNLETCPLPKAVIGIIFELSPPQTDMARIITKYKKQLPIFRELSICRFPNIPSLVIKQFVWGAIIGKPAPCDNHPVALIQMLQMKARGMPLFCRMLKNMCDCDFFMGTDAKFQ